MAYSKCPKCDNTRFEIKENVPSGSRYKFIFIQCSSCGAVVGAMDYYNTGARLAEIEKKVDSLKSSSYGLNTLNSNLNVVNNNITKLFNYIKSKI